MTEHARIQVLSCSPCLFLDEEDSAEARCVEHIMREYARGYIDRESIAELAKRGILPYPVNNLVADIVLGKAKEKRGAKPQKYSTAAEGMLMHGELRKRQAAGESYYSARQSVAKQFGISERTLDSRISDYQRARNKNK